MVIQGGEGKRGPSCHCRPAIMGHVPCTSSLYRPPPVAGIQSIECPDFGDDSDEVLMVLRERYACMMEEIEYCTKESTVANGIGEIK